jgi:hypothetical protein
MIKHYSSVNPNPFIGRTKELSDIAARLVDPGCRLLTLTGLGGSGKTRLAIEAARTVAAQFPHGAAFVGLQPLTRSDLIVPAIAQAVGLTPYSEGDLQQQLLDYLAEKTLLLILDNFEHVLDGAAFVSTMLASAPGVKALATSREALSLRLRHIVGRLRGGAAVSVPCAARPAAWQSGERPRVAYSNLRHDGRAAPGD